MNARIPALGGLALLGGCMSLPAERTVSCAEANRPAISISPDGRTAFTQIDVVTYNIEGLPAPVHGNRNPFLREIGQRLAAFRAQGQAPDIIVFQEVFSSAASRAIVDSGYSSIASGPSARSRQAPNTEGSLPGRRRILKGEVRANFLSSGLVIATDFPIVASNLQPYGRGSCAGFDCLANKGMLYAEIAIPGVPGTIDIFNTHMQAARASKVSTERHSEAHIRQANELSAFSQANGSLASPTIIAGDFNMRNSDVRYYNLTRRIPYESVHRFCIERPNECDVRQEWTHDDQWLRVQDKQLFLSGTWVKVRPVQAEGMFDGGTSGPVLSDHNGFRVVYQLSWPTKGAVPPPVCPPTGQLSG
jgi:endonuclease/exonuclease/phosphatase family metal-dependent hydrolase